jgi:hypothetical protein
MGIIRKTFTFWLIIGIIAAVVVALVMPKLKDKVLEKIPGRNEAMQMVEKAKTAIKSFQDTPEVKQKVQEEVKEESIDEPAPKVVVLDSVKGRDAKLFKRQCSILDDLI